KSVIRVERGTINRNIYQIVSFYDPAVPSSAWSPQKGWNQKLLWKYGSGAAFSRFEESAGPGSIPGNLDDAALRRGFMTAQSNLTNNGQNTNNTLAAET